MDEPVRERVSGNAARGKRRIKAIRTLTDIKISPAPPTRQDHDQSRIVRLITAVVRSIGIQYQVIIFESKKEKDTKS